METTDGESVSVPLASRVSNGALIGGIVGGIMGLLCIVGIGVGAVLISRRNKLNKEVVKEIREPDIGEYVAAPPLGASVYGDASVVRSSMAEVASEYENPDSVLHR